MNFIWGPQKCFISHSVAFSELRGASLLRTPPDEGPVFEDEDLGMKA